MSISFFVSLLVSGGFRGYKMKILARNVLSGEINLTKQSGDLLW